MIIMNIINNIELLNHILNTKIHYKLAVNNG